MTVVDVMRGQYTPTSLSRRVVAMAKKWETHRVMIEATPGAHTMVQHINNEALEAGWRIEIVWTEFLQDETARALSIKSAEPHLLAGRLLFDHNVDNLQEVFRQLYHYGMVEETDVANVVSRVVAQLPPSIAAADFNVNDEEAFNAFIERDAYDRTYNRGRYETPPEPVVEEEWTPPNDDSGYMPGLTG
jgi:hypothetical protein